MTTSDERAEQERAEYEAQKREEALQARLSELGTRVAAEFDRMARSEATLIESLLENLTAVQARCTQQEEEIRRLRRSLAGANTPIGEIGVWTLYGGERTWSPEADLASVRVGDFMRAFGQATPPKPTIPSDDVVRLRLRLIAEEFFELLEASLYVAQVRHGDEDWDNLQSEMLEMINECRVRVDLPELVDAMADLDYVIEGTRLAFGVNGKAIAEAVHRSNMAKIGGPIDANGKVQKPGGWTPPNIKALLVEQGWEP